MKSELDGNCDQKRDGATRLVTSWTEPPALGRSDRLLIQTESWVERANHTRSHARPVGKHRALDPDFA